MPRLNFARIAAVALTGLVLLPACKQVPNPTGGDTANGGGGAGGSPPANNSGNALTSYTFVGSWKGVYRNDDAATDLHQTDATATFEGTGADFGTFHIELPLQPNVYIAGNYQIFSQSSVFLNITQSTISTLGEPNSTSDFTYTLLGSKLELKKDKVAIKLTRLVAPGSQPQAVPGSTTPGATDPLYAHWRCNDARGHQWQPFLQEHTFSIEVSDPQNERGALWLQGPLTITRSAGRPDATMTVQDSDTAKYKGMELSVVILPSGQMKLTRTTPPVEDMVCDRGVN